MVFFMPKFKPDDAPSIGPQAGPTEPGIGQ